MFSSDEYFNSFKDEQYKRLMELADQFDATPRTREESLRVLVEAGILNEDGNFKEPYTIFEQYTASK